ncbi:sugar ABC transporter substrate-binding protein [Nocardioides sp.]|uniref:sugar ABC transporter substrate-binding protein n=1 Tax=Nocardioides sp. TaxID=35761 RepID=UPI00260B2DD9|nr:sugar ABC transporter substrate-binding protein [Nocardioides sp.]
MFTSLRTSPLRFAPIAVSVIGALTLSACGSSSDATSTPASDGASTSASSSAGVTHAKEQIEKYAAPREHYGTVPAISSVPNLQGKTVWYVPIGTSVPVLQAMGQGITEAFKALGASVHMCDGKFTPTTVASCMESAANQKADAVITGFVDYEAVPSAFQSLASQGIPTLAAGVAQPKGVQSSKTLGFFDPSALTHIAYQLMADAVIADSNGSANVIQVGLTDSSTTKGNTQAAADELKQYCPSCKVTTVETTTADASNLGSLVSAKLSANPKTNYLILPQDSFFQAALPGLQSAGFTDKVKVVTASGSPAGLQAVKAGQIAYNIGQGAIEQGWAMADGAVRLLSGVEVVPEVDGPVRVFTKANVGDLDISDANYNSSVWYGGDAWKQDFLTAWGVK